MKYYIMSFDGSDKKEITYSNALDYVLRCYKDSDMTRDMLSIINRIQLRGSYITVEKETEHGKNMVLMAGYVNAVPDGVQYDDNCNRI